MSHLSQQACEPKKSYIPHLKVLVGGINVSSSQWCGCISIMCNSCLNLALLPHKTVLVNFPICTTVAQGLWYWDFSKFKVGKNTQFFAVFISWRNSKHPGKNILKQVPYTSQTFCIWIYLFSQFSLFEKELSCILNYTVHSLMSSVMRLSFFLFCSIAF